MSVKTEIAKYGSGVGFIYLTDSNDVIKRTLPNDFIGREDAERQMLVSSVLTSNISASSTVTVTAAGGDITNLSFNGVSVFDVTTPVTGATTDDLAANLAIAINGYLSTPEYTAVSSGSVVTVYLDADQGSSLNGTAGASSTTGTAALTITDLDGGSYSTGDVDSQIGFKMYLNPSATATAGTIVGATDVTSAVLKKSAGTPYSVRDVEISSGSISVDRDGSVTVIDVQTEGAVAADDLTSIDAGIFSDGDTLIIRGKEAGKVTTVKEGGNIELANNADFLTGAKEFVIILQYSTSDNKWYEINRSPGNDLTVASLRSSSIAVPVQGVELSAINFSGASTTITPGTDKGYWTLTGSGTLTGSVSYSLASGLVEGDEVIIRFNGGVTLGGFSFTIAGYPLTQNQATNGLYVIAKWNGSVWYVSYLANGQRDLVDETQLATKEDSLGNPASDGQILSSTTGGTRSWVDNNTDIVVAGDGTTNSSTAGVETTLRTVTIPANTLSTNGSTVILDVFGDFNSNANNKWLRLKFNGTIIDSNVFTAAPNGVRFQARLIITRANNTVVKCSGSILINGAVAETDFVQISSLDLTTTSYDIEVTGEGAGASDVNVYGSIVNKYIV